MFYKQKYSITSTFVLVGVFFVLTSLPAFTFDFKRDISSRCFWTKAYKEKHPKPTNNMPKTMSEYYREANKAGDSKKDIPSPQFPRDEKLVDLPDPDLSLKKYNNPPGMVEINLNNLRKSRKINSIGVVSPLHDKMVYTTIYYYPSRNNAASEFLVMKLDTTKSLQQRVESAHVNQGKKTIYKSGMDSFELDVFKTLTVLDWSVDGKKVALKEKISYTADGLWKTNLLVYDFTTGTIRDLTEVREAIRYYWREHKDVQLSDNRWDIYPIGWDVLNPDRIIVFAYAATGGKPKYLGAWSVDYKGERAMLMSLTRTDFEISQNGLSIKVKYD